MIKLRLMRLNAANEKYDSTVKATEKIADIAESLTQAKAELATAQVLNLKLNLLLKLKLIARIRFI